MINATQVTRKVEDFLHWCRHYRWLVLGGVIFLLLSRYWLAGGSPADTNLVQPKEAANTDAWWEVTKSKQRELGANDRMTILLNIIRLAALAPIEEFTSFDGPVVIPVNEPDVKTTYILFRLNYLNAAREVAAKLIRVYPKGQWSDLGPTLTTKQESAKNWHQICEILWLST